jgi:hypothetical protein
MYFNIQFSNRILLGHCTTAVEPTCRNDKLQLPSKHCLLEQYQKLSMNPPKPFDAVDWQPE